MIAKETMPEATTWIGKGDPVEILHSAADIAIPMEAMSPVNTNRDVIQHFKDHPDLVSLPVVEDGIPIGMINRGIFLTGFSLPFHREIYERKSCIAFMDKTPLVVSGEISIAELGQIAVDAGSKVLQDGFLVTRNGCFHGLGTGLDLLRALGRLEADRNRVIRESIAYAEIIQGSLLATSKGELKAGGLAGQHLLWKPRDQVGGDAFFARRTARNGRKGLFLALMDCTGHGVPGAFTAMLMTSFLGHALDLANPWEPGKVMAEVNRRVKEELGQSHQSDDSGDADRAREESAADEGMDVTCLWIEQNNSDVVFSGARHSLWVFHPGSSGPEEIKGDRIGVGYVGTPDDQTWTSQALQFVPGTVLLGLSDGIVDQIGGPRRIAFGKRRLWEAFLEENASRSLQTRLERAYFAMEAYQGREDRRDDVSMLAIQL